MLFCFVSIRIIIFFFYSKWKNANEKISGILAIPDSNNILTASKTIKLWDIYTTDVLKSFTGHSYEVTLLYYIQPKENSSAYFISASKVNKKLVNKNNLHFI